jgi:hypothetical protein
VSQEPLSKQNLEFLTAFSEAWPMSHQITPFKIAATDDQLDDLKRRLRATRWPERECVDDWSQGLPLAYAQEVCKYWLEKYDWRQS